MGYEEDCDVLWERSTQQRSKDAIGTVELLSAAEAAVVAAREAPLPRAQLIALLAVAASYAAHDFDWVLPKVQQRGDSWITTIAKQLGIGTNSEPVIDAAIFREMCTARVQPYFDRPAAPKQAFTLAGETRLPDTIVARRWMEYPQCIAAFVWAFQHLADSDIGESISSILPVIITLVDDYDCQAQLWGLRLAQSLVVRGDSVFLRKSGICKVISDSAAKCLTYRSDANEFASTLMEAAFRTAIAACDVLYPSSADPRYTSQLWKLVSQVITNDVYIADNVVAATVLCAQVTPLCERLGMAIARYLRPLVGIVTHPLHAPAHLSEKVCELHVVAVRQILSLVKECPARAYAYVDEFVAALALSWNSTANKKAAPLQGHIDSLRSLILEAVGRLSLMDSGAMGRAIERLDSARPGVFVEWTAATSKLADTLPARQ